MTNGLVIILNGTSSSGKTSLARALQELAPEPIMYWGIDHWGTLFSDRFLGPNRPTPLSDEAVERLISGYHRVAAAQAAPGNWVVLDTLLMKPEWVAELQASLQGLRVCFVGVRCPLEELERRELARGDREIGLSRRQFEVVHRHGDYDIALDTTLVSPEDGARRILDLLSQTPSPSAFWRLTPQVAS